MPFVPTGTFDQSSTTTTSAAAASAARPRTAAVSGASRRWLMDGLLALRRSPVAVDSPPGQGPGQEGEGPVAAALDVRVAIGVPLVDVADALHGLDADAQGRTPRGAGVGRVSRRMTRQTVANAWRARNSPGP